MSQQEDAAIQGADHEGMPILASDPAADGTPEDEGAEIGDDLPPDRAFALGGPESFPGYGIGELRARKYWVAGGNFLYPLTTFASLKEENLYGGLGLQAGDLYERVDPVPNGRVYSISAFFGGRTPVGTLTFGAGTER